MTTKKPVVIFEELVYFGHCEVIDFDEFMYLFFKHGSLMTSDFVLVDDVDCPGEGGLEVDGLPELVELVLLEAGGQQFVLLLDTALDLLDEVVLPELDIVLLAHDLDCAFIAGGW
jgi:hypothetical protein